MSTYKLLLVYSWIIVSVGFVFKLLSSLVLYAWYMNCTKTSNLKWHGFIGWEQ